MFLASKGLKIEWCFYSTMIETNILTVSTYIRQTKFCGWKKTQQKELDQSTWDENYTIRCVRLQHLHKTVCDCEIYKNVLANHTGR
jgi:hypothetical protein